MIFYKYVGCGNDFILIDNRKGLLPEWSPLLVRRLCDRRFGIGADGLLLCAPSTHPYKMELFNSDGSRPEMCGNGLRCFAKWICESEGKNAVDVEVSGSTYLCSLKGEEVSVEMPPPKDIRWNLPLNYQGNILEIDSLDTGVPHVVSFVNCVEEIDLEAFGPYVRDHAFWKEKGTNVNVAERLGRSTFKMRTYERGVGETAACGTGAVAVALSAGKRFGIEEAITLVTSFGYELNVAFSFEKESFHKIVQVGRASFVFSGEMDHLKII